MTSPVRIVWRELAGVSGVGDGVVAAAVAAGLRYSSGDSSKCRYCWGMEVELASVDMCEVDYDGEMVVDEEVCRFERNVDAYPVLRLVDWELDGSGPVEFSVGPVTVRGGAVPVAAFLVAQLRGWVQLWRHHRAGNHVHVGSVRRGVLMPSVAPHLAVWLTAQFADGDRAEVRYGFARYAVGCDVDLPEEAGGCEGEGEWLRDVEAALTASSLGWREYVASRDRRPYGFAVVNPGGGGKKPTAELRFSEAVPLVAWLLAELVVGDAYREVVGVVKARDVARFRGELVQYLLSVYRDGVDLDSAVEWVGVEWRWSGASVRKLLEGAVLRRARTPAAWAVRYGLERGVPPSAVLRTQGEVEEFLRSGEGRRFLEELRRWLRGAL